MMSVDRNYVGVCLCAVLKASICGMLGSIFAITVAKTVSGLQQAAHPMQILNAILAWWARTGSDDNVPFARLEAGKGLYLAQ